ncbi:hypothetical protein GCWU000325_02650 [Alloprevotella tannerae ATCC 51259]|uniref:Uncharacterized protein n=1 Tax=Alloprevotella tannerae ATCC 51259 TaxID=626522 RepID=C9LK85_9BACT|nr:hypothetical protein GCWU000325_02650 [Alloprevotella tannerae ATCC 51259]
MLKIRQQATLLPTTTIEKKGQRQAKVVKKITFPRIVSEESSILS